MALGSWYSAGITGVMNGTIPMNSPNLQLMLIKNTYVFNVSDTVTTIATHETAVANYVRKTINSLNPVFSHTAKSGSIEQFEKLDIDDIVYTALGSGDTIAGVAFIYFITDDASSTSIGYLPITPVALTGADFTLTVNANGLVRLFEKTV